MYVIWQHSETSDPTLVGPFGSREEADVWVQTFQIPWIPDEDYSVHYVREPSEISEPA